MTFWRRHRGWAAAGVWGRVWAAVPGESARAGWTPASCSWARRSPRTTGGVRSGRTGGGVGVEVAVVIDRTGMPVGVATDAADVPEAVVGPAAAACLPAGVRLRWGLPPVAARAYDADPLRDDSAERGFVLIAPHRRNRVRPPTGDGRRLRRYRRRWRVERAVAWLHSYRRVVTRFERDIGRYDGLVHLACAFMALNRLVK